MLEFLQDIRLVTWPISLKYLPLFSRWPTNQKIGWRIFLADWAGFVCLKFPFNPLNFTSHQRNCCTKSLSNFAKLQFINDKIDQNTNFFQIAKVQMAFFCTTVNFIIKELKFCKTFQLFCVCQFLWWEVNLRELKGNLKQKNPAWVMWQVWYLARILE